MARLSLQPERLPNSSPTPASYCSSCTITCPKFNSQILRKHKHSHTDGASGQPKHTTTLFVVIRNDPTDSLTGSHSLNFSPKAMTSTWVPVRPNKHRHRSRHSAWIMLRDSRCKPSSHKSLPGWTRGRSALEARECQASDGISERLGCAVYESRYRSSTTSRDRSTSMCD